ncbi:MAG TPA: peptidoglycan-binding protein LysM [Chitinophagales bacterium]|nr:peptidoglycan-binding protein LysM [Chitinophagales bacterium]
MGLISFMKNAGAKLFGKKEEAPVAQTAAPAPVLSQEELDAQKALALEAAVRSHGLNIEDLYVQVNEDIAIVHGKAANVADKEKAILVCGNVEGIAHVDDRLTLPQDERSVPEPESQYYTVEKGDTLSKISKEFYGTANKYMVIFEANKPMLKDPDKIYVGQVLRIPPLS